MIGLLILIILYKGLELFIKISINFNTINTQDILGYSEIETLYKQLGLMFTGIPSVRLKSILDKYNLVNYRYILEFNPNNLINLPVKQTLNTLAGVYICINLINGNIYVGSASKNCMYRRYVGHLLKAAGGSVLVKRAVNKYGLENFAFVVVETTNNVKNKEEILFLEQKFIDLLQPKYNIAKLAGSVLNMKWSLKSKNK